MDWYPRRPQSYRNDTWGLTLAEHGAYCLLLDYYYSSECPLPSDDLKLASIIGCSLDDWLLVKQNVTRYFRVSNAHLTHQTCDEVIERSLGRRKDGLQRQVKYKKRLDSVTRLSRVSNAPIGEDRIVEDKKEESTFVANAPKKVNGYSVEFEGFWVVYPKKVGKGDALKAYLKAIKRGATHEQIISGAERYAAACKRSGTEKQFIRGPEKWINGDGWLDEDMPAARNQDQAKNGFIELIRSGKV